MLDACKRHTINVFSLAETKQNIAYTHLTHDATQARTKCEKPGNISVLRCIDNHRMWLCSETSLPHVRHAHTSSLTVGHTSITHSIVLALAFIYSITHTAKSYSRAVQKASLAPPPSQASSTNPVPTPYVSPVGSSPQCSSPAAATANTQTAQPNAAATQNIFRHVG